MRGTSEAVETEMIPNETSNTDMETEMPCVELTEVEMTEVKAFVDDNLEKALNEAKDSKKSLETEEEVTEGSRYDQEESSKINDEIKDVNDRVLLNNIAPQIALNEEKKREHKTILIKSLLLFLHMQGIALFVFIAAITFIIVFGHITKNDFSPDYLDIIFKFFLAYISSLVLEVIVVLKIIVKNVFDSSISDLMKFYKNSKNCAIPVTETKDAEDAKEVGVSVIERFMNQN